MCLLRECLLQAQVFLLGVHIKASHILEPIKVGNHRLLALPVQTTDHVSISMVSPWKLTMFHAGSLLILSPVLYKIPNKSL